MNKDSTRTVLAFVGGLLVANGEVTVEDLTVLLDHIKTVAGALVTVGALGWGYLDTKKEKTDGNV